MAKSGYRVTLGEDPKFTPAKDDKMAFAHVRLAEDSWSFDQGTGEFERGETTWYDGQFFGKDAEALHEQFQKGDKILVLGRVVEDTVTRNGTEYQNTHLRVDTFGPDMKHTNVSIDRTPRASATHAQAVSQQQSAAPAQNVSQQQQSVAQPQTQADWKGQVQNVMSTPAVGASAVESQVDQYYASNPHEQMQTQSHAMRY